MAARREADSVRVSQPAQLQELVRNLETKGDDLDRVSRELTLKNGLLLEAQTEIEEGRHKLAAVRRSPDESVVASSTSQDPELKFNQLQSRSSQLQVLLDQEVAESERLRQLLNQHRVQKEVDRTQLEESHRAQLAKVLRARNHF